MSAAETIEQFKSLSADEQAKQFVALRAVLEREQEALKERLAEIEHVLGSHAGAAAKVNDEFKKIADHVFTKNAELFRKLAQ